MSSRFRLSLDTRYLTLVTRLMREPLVHFLLIGAALFLLFSFMSSPAGDKANRIVVTPGQVEQLAARFKGTWLRPPSKEEIAGLIESYVRDEVYYREATAMGLDKNDGVIRRRMRMKLEFILEDISAQAEPTDEELTAFLQKHRERFQQEAQISFRQVYLNPDKRRDTKGDVKKILARLRGGTKPEAVGDPIMVGYEFELSYESDVERLFGESFARQIVTLVPGDWAGPVISGLGTHLVMVSERKERRMPELAEVRAMVEREWLAQHRQELKDAIYRKFLEGYEVVMEQPKAADYGSGTAVAATPAGGETR